MFVYQFVVTYSCYECQISTHLSSIKSIAGDLYTHLIESITLNTEFPLETA